MNHIGGQTNPAESSALIVPSPKHRRAKQGKRSPGGGDESIGRNAAPKTIEADPLPLLVSPELFYNFNREELYEKAWKIPMQELATECGVPEGTLRRRFERLWIPFPSRNYWAKKAANRPVAPRPPLPKVQIQREKKLPAPISETSPQHQVG